MVKISLSYKRLQKQLVQFFIFNKESQLFFFYVFSLLVKVCDKRFIMKEKKSEYIMREKTVLTKTNHPFIIKLHYTFQDPDRLCILFKCLNVKVQVKLGLSYLQFIFQFVHTSR